MRSDMVPVRPFPIASFQITPRRIKSSPRCRGQHLMEKLPGLKGSQRRDHIGRQS
jgi:hypothetical protein